MPVNLLKVLLPIGILALAGIGGTVILSMKKEVETTRADKPVRLVRAMTAKVDKETLKVRVFGSVRPEIESNLVAQVAGRIESVSPSFKKGGFFKEKYVLITLEQEDYDYALARAQLQLKQAELRLKQEQKEAELARLEWEKFGKGEPDDLVVRKPQLAQARAALAAAQADVKQAELNQKRTRIIAPFDGRVWEKYVDKGQFVAPGAMLAKVYSTNFAEIRLPIPDAQLAFLDLPLDYQGEVNSDDGPAVTIRGTFGGTVHTWKGTIVRTEAEIDPKTRLVHAIARVKAPYRKDADHPGRPPLAVGMFVEAEITGREVDGVVVLPRSALRNRTTVLVIDKDSKLEIRPVTVLRAEGDRVVICGGIQDGERICLSPLEIVVNGMQVKVSE